MKSKNLKPGDEIEFLFFGISKVKGKFISMEDGGVITFEVISDTSNVYKTGSIDKAHRDHLK